MDYHDKESFYPMSFRSKDIFCFTESIKLHQSVELIGMKRVGINNFLRYFLIKKDKLLDKKFIIIMIDLNNLFEREVFAFWRLTLKRITDVVKQSSLPEDVISKISHSFDISIQTNDALVTFDGIREAISLIVQNQYNPVFIFNRFDRLKDAATEEFYDNLIALKDAGHSRTSFIFTSYRELEKLRPDVFKYTSSSGFSQRIYVKPVNLMDSQVVSDQIEKQYQLKIDQKHHQTLLEMCGGHIQYLRLSLLAVHEYLKIYSKISSHFFQLLGQNERVIFQSDELWESLTPPEQEVIKKITLNKRLSVQDKLAISYIEQTGFVYKVKRHWHLFSPLFFDYVEKKLESKSNSNSLEFTRQEHKLFSYLKENLNKVCERDQIITVVWPESSEWGASDWSLDKLVARVRIKLKNQQNMFQILTIRTRGYKLIQVGDLSSNNIEVHTN